jgi:hypothetical protein
VPAWWLGPYLTVATDSDRIARAAAPVFAPLALPVMPVAAVRLEELASDSDIRLALDGHPLARCADEASLVFFLESLLTHLATHGNRSALVLHAGLVR